ncbi:hypothetical protein HDV00_004021 [Rhizophlyctis rosea]|nr:hypothetical protein HDV00_004021 [Rhizophlyctis rosea]
MANAALLQEVGLEEDAAADEKRQLETQLLLGRAINNNLMEENKRLKEDLAVKDAECRRLKEERDTLAEQLKLSNEGLRRFENELQNHDRNMTEALNAISFPSTDELLSAKTRNEAQNLMVLQISTGTVQRLATSTQSEWVPFSTIQQKLKEKEYNPLRTCLHKMRCSELVYAHMKGDLAKVVGQGCGQLVLMGLLEWGMDARTEFFFRLPRAVVEKLGEGGVMSALKNTKPHTLIMDIESILNTLRQFADEKSALETQLKTAHRLSLQELQDLKEITRRISDEVPAGGNLVRESSSASGASGGLDKDTVTGNPAQKRTQREETVDELQSKRPRQNTPNISNTSIQLYQQHQTQRTNLKKPILTPPNFLKDLQTFHTLQSHSITSFTFPPYTSTIYKLTPNHATMHRLSPNAPRHPWVQHSVLTQYLKARVFNPLRVCWDEVGGDGKMAYCTMEVELKKAVVGDLMAMYKAKLIRHGKVPGGDEAESFYCLLEDVVARLGGCDVRRGLE